MAYMGMALGGEGPTDGEFLGIVLQRVAEDICLRRGRYQIDVGEVRSLQARTTDVEATARAAAAESGGYHVLFLHLDRGGAALQQDRSHTERLVQTVQEVVPDRVLVKVLPVQETEAWALADGDALRAAFRTRLSDQRLGLPGTPAQVESVTGPKERLNEIYRRTRSSRRRGSARPSARQFLDAIARQIQLDRLRLIPAFQAFEAELTDALRSLGHIRD